MSRNNSSKRPKLASEGFLGRLNYFFVRAVINIRQNVFVNILTIGTITLALLIISYFLLLFVNLNGLADNWSNKVQVTAYFDQELAPQEQATIKSRIMSLPGTDRVAYISKDEAMKRFRSRLKGQESLLEGVTPEVLPAALEISLKKGYRDTQAVESYVVLLKKLSAIKEVQYGEEWVKRFSTFMNFMRLVGALLGGFLLLAVIFIVSNTIKLTIYSRKEELELLGLVGATRLFIKAPFLIEGIMQGVAGALLSLVILVASYFVFLHNAGNFISFKPSDAGLSFLPAEYIAAILLGGMLLGFLGSLTSLKRFINF
jgi:cell division transport system permease protein